MIFCKKTMLGNKKKTDNVIMNIASFLFRTSCIFSFRTSVIFCSGHPVFLIPDCRFLDYGHPDIIRETGCRYGLLRLMSVKKRWDEKGLPRWVSNTVKKNVYFHLSRKLSFVRSKLKCSNSMKSSIKSSRIKFDGDGDGEYEHTSHFQSVYWILVRTGKHPEISMAVFFTFNVSSMFFYAWKQNQMKK